MGLNKLRKSHRIECHASIKIVLLTIQQHEKMFEKEKQKHQYTKST